MKRVVFFLLLLISIFSVTMENAYAIGNGEVVQGRQTFFYDVQLQDHVRALIFDGEWGFTPTLALDGRYAYAAPVHYLHFFLKFKLYESKSLNMAGRAGLVTDFAHLHKTLGFVLSKDQNSFLKTHGGFDYSVDSREIGFFVGIDYKLTAHTYFQAGYEKFITRSAYEGLTIGLRSDI